MTKNSIKETTNFKGKYIITKAFLETKGQFALNEKIVKEREKLLQIIAKKKSAKGKALETLEKKEYLLRETMIDDIRQLNSICRTEITVKNNIVPTVCRTMVANNFASASPTNSMKITHCCLGSSSTAPSNADTQLGTETYRNAIASLTNASNVVYATGFFSAAECSGTYAEAGIVSNGTGTANTGILDSHVLATIVKTTSQTVTIDFTLTQN